MLGSRSNEARLRGKHVVIKCAKSATNSIGVIFNMLRRLDSVIAAFQIEDDCFELWSLAIPVFRSEMRVTRSKGNSAGKVGQVRRSVFVNRGKLLGRVQTT